MAFTSLCAAQCGEQKNGQSSPNTAQEKPASTPPAENTTEAAQPNQDANAMKPTPAAPAKPVAKNSGVPASEPLPTSEKNAMKEVPIGGAPDQQNVDKIKAEQEKQRKKEQGKKD